MSWLQQIQKDFVIALTVGKSLKTAKRVEYKPNWLNANRSVDFNIAEFNFKNQRGTLVRRGTPMGRKYSLEIYFQGADNLTTATQFMADAEYPYAWQITHPMYGALYVQPISMTLDDRDYNATKVICQVMETLGAANRPNINVDPVEVIKAKQLSTDITTATVYEVAIPNATADDIAGMQDNANFLKAGATAFATVTADAQAAVNAYNRAWGEISNAANGTFAAIRAIQYLINLPALFTNNVRNRVAFLAGQVTTMYATLTNLTTPRRKRLYENNVGTIITSMCTATVTNVTSTDYRNRAEVIQVVEYIVNSYNTFVTNLDTLQTTTGDTLDSYVPNFSGIFETSILVKYTVSNLLLLAENAAQQRTYRTEKDTNVILMAYKFYGMLPDDSTIQRVMDENNICLNEILQIKKGRDLVYYVGV